MILVPSLRRATDRYHKVSPQTLVGLPLAPKAFRSTQHPQDFTPRGAPPKSSCRTGLKHPLPPGASSMSLPTDSTPAGFASTPGLTTRRLRISGSPVTPSHAVPHASGRHQRSLFPSLIYQRSLLSTGCSTGVFCRRQKTSMQVEDTHLNLREHITRQVKTGASH